MNKNANPGFLKVLNIVSFIAMVAVNALAQLLPLGGQTTAQISDKYPSLFTPAGITFSIWFVIYAGLAWVVAYQTFAKRNNSIERVDMLFSISCILNILWIVFWHYQLIPASLAVILVLLVVLGVIDRRVQDEHWSIRAPFSIYFAWIMAASIANVFVAFSARAPLGFNTPLAQVLTITVIVVAAVVGAGRVIRKNDYPYAFTIVWTIVGIMIKHMSKTGFAGMYEWVIYAAAIASVALLFVIFTVMDDNRFLARQAGQ